MPHFPFVATYFPLREFCIPNPYPSGNSSGSTRFAGAFNPSFS